MWKRIEKKPFDERKHVVESNRGETTNNTKYKSTQTNWKASKRVDIYTE